MILLAAASVAPDTLPLNEVVVTGSNIAVGRNLLPYSVTTISTNRLEATGSTQLLSAISSMVPSLFVTQRNVFGFGVSNGGSGHIKIRGVGGDRASAVLMMVDGQPQFAGLYSHHIADFYGTEMAERVEVLRGPASVLYGSNAMAGVINVITKNPSHKGVTTTLSSQYGSYNTWITSATNAVNYGRISSFASADYGRTDGVVKNFDFNQARAYAKVGYELSTKWCAKADYALTLFNASDPVYPALQGRNGIYAQKVIRGEVSVMAVNKYVFTNGAVRAYYSYGNHFIHDPNYFHSLDDRLGFIAYQNFSPWKSALATFGFDFDRYTGKIPISGGKDHTQAPLATLPRKAIAEYSPYVTLQQPFCYNRLLLNAGLRMANSNIFHTQWIPQAGFVIDCSHGATLKGSVAKGYRNPSFRELYLYKFANPKLRPESMTNYEITFAHHLNNHFSFDLTAYFANGSNIIQQTSILNENTGSFVNKGIEFSARVLPVASLSIWASYSYLHSSLCNLTGAPAHQFYLSTAWNALPKFHIDAEVKGVYGLFVADKVPMQNYVTINCRLTYKLLPILKLFVNLDNITNTRYTINYGYPMPGFNAMGGFKLTI